MVNKEGKTVKNVALSKLRATRKSEDVLYESNCFHGVVGAVIRGRKGYRGGILVADDVYFLIFVQG